ncbi:MAG TPA: hypothetical protein VI864_06480 [Candidatus Bathyarchaeia archaeon]|nr:hypothetical protein [Candidatus Bathyarchaeia archaeon]
MLVRNHLLCPYDDCVAHSRKRAERIQVLVDEKRSVILKKTFPEKTAKTRLPYLNKKWIVPGKCPYCSRGLEVVIDETRKGRNIHLKLP